MSAYRLRLADGQSWQFLASRGAAAWLARFASILELKTGPAPGSRRLIFVRRGELGAFRPEDLARVGLNLPLPADGWSSRDPMRIRLLHNLEVEDVVCELTPRSGRGPERLMMRCALLPIFEQALERGGLAFHAALIERDGRGVLLCAPSGIGKSTCAGRIPRPWRALADDDALVLKTGPGRYAAHPFPTWSDYILGRSRRTWRVESSVPLRAIFFLDKSPSDAAVPIGQGEASALAGRLPGQVLVFGWHGLPKKLLWESRLSFYNNACELAKSVPAFILKVSLKGKFWREIERVLSP